LRSKFACSKVHGRLDPLLKGQGYMQSAILIARSVGASKWNQKDAPDRVVILLCKVVITVKVVSLYFLAATN
jgi:hypothetical protein